MVSLFCKFYLILSICIYLCLHFNSAISQNIAYHNENIILKSDRRLIDTVEWESPENINRESGKSDIKNRTATGGVIRNILSFLSFVAFVGNGIFMIYVFWM